MSSQPSTSLLYGAGMIAAAATLGPLGFVGAMLVYSIATRPNGKDRRSQGSTFLLRENPTDPNEPIGLGYGMPTIVPPVLFRYLKASTLNSLKADESKSFVMGLSLGGGPIDGRDLMAWMNDEPLLEGQFDDELDKRDTSGKRFRFRHRDVVPDSIVIYR